MIVQDQLSAEWPAEADFTTAPWGYESDDHYLVVCGPYARIFGARNSADLEWEEPVLDAPLICVVKETGVVEELEHGQSVFTPVGAQNPDEE